MTSEIDESYRYLAAKYLRKQARQLAKQLDGIRRADDIEFVHQARVASRRLRAATRMFRDCFAPKQLKRWRRHIRRVTTGLGDARDKDVQIEFLCGMLDALREKACYPALARLLVKSEQKRERLQPNVIRAADRLEASGILDEMAAETEQVLSKAKGREVGVQSDSAFCQTGQHILERLDQMLSYQEGLADPEDQQRHHAMRIAAKRLRYTMEIAKPVYDGQLDSAIPVIKKLQTLLGEVHDCDVWVAQLDTFARKERKRILKNFGHAGPFARLEVGIEYLRQERRQRRRQVFQELVDCCQDLSGQGYWEELANTVRAGGKLPAELEPPIDATPQPTPKPARHWDKSNGAGSRETVARESSARNGQTGEPAQPAEVPARTFGREAVSP